MNGHLAFLTDSLACETCAGCIIVGGVGWYAQVIFDSELAPGQLRNLEKAFGGDQGGVRVSRRSSFAVQPATLHNRSRCLDQVSKYEVLFNHGLLSYLKACIFLLRGMSGSNVLLHYHTNPCSALIMDHVLIRSIGV